MRSARLPISADIEENSLEELESQEEDEEDLSELSDEQYDDKTWIEWHCSGDGNECLVEVEEDFIKDDFNLTGLTQIPLYERALDMILDNEDEDQSDSDFESVDQISAQLYGLIHARFIVTTRGLQLATSKFTSGVYGKCPNAMCKGQNALPIGVTDQANQHTCSLYCPKCKEMYVPPPDNKLGRLDGAYFGTTFAPLFCLMYPSLIPKTEREIYVPKIYGFRVHRNIRTKLRQALAHRATAPLST